MGFARLPVATLHYPPARLRGVFCRGTFVCGLFIPRFPRIGIRFRPHIDLLTHLPLPVTGQRDQPHHQRHTPALVGCPNRLRIMPTSHGNCAKSPRSNKLPLAPQWGHCPTSSPSNSSSQTSRVNVSNSGRLRLKPSNSRLRGSFSFRALEWCSP